MGDTATGSSGGDGAYKEVRTCCSSLTRIRTDVLLKIASLRYQLQAQMARSTQLHGRLTSAMDAMETLQGAHARELGAERDTRKRLNQKLERLTEYTQAVEEERDELRDAALALVERGTSHRHP